MQEEIYEVEMEEVPEIEPEVKEEKQKKSLRKRIGERLISDEPLMSKKVKRGVAIALGGLATLGAVAVGFIARGGGAPDELPELTDGLEGTDELPFDPDIDVMEGITE